MDFTENIRQKADKLTKQAEILVSIPINWEDPIKVNCSELTSIETLKRKMMFDVFNPHKQKPAIYFFEIKNQIDPGVVVNALKNFKNTGERSCPKIDKRSLDSKFLYCGSRKEGLHGRFIQHLGFGSRNTYALQLCHWAKDLNVEIEFNYAWIDARYVDFTELLESALAMKLMPLVGKLA